MKKPNVVIRQLFERFLSSGPEATAGTAAIEFAFVSLFIIALMLPAADLGVAIYRSVQVQNSAQAGAQYAMLRGFSANGISGAVTAATRYSGVSASPAPIQFCGCPTTTGLSNVPCNSTCPSGLTAGTYVTASAQSTHDTIFRYPTIPAQFPLAAKSTVRIK